MDFKVCHHGLPGLPSWTSRFAIMDFKVCHHGLQGMPPWTTRYAMMDYKVCHQRFKGMLLWICVVYLLESRLRDEKAIILKLFSFISFIGDDSILPLTKKIILVP